MFRRLEDSRLCEEFDQWIGPSNSPEISLKYSWAMLRLGGLVTSEKQRRFPNTLPQRITHTDTYFWACLRTL
ncbi:hypothetical protein CUMW_226790 [Citrus unshiu]|uniref:Uncharacterized protein n=1 Tax=Citrus unshiu TaxID=55188 RepID=A0A2H5QG30_CITUN|nr:hypothetical protein CUMW_226790 [Citrus unshiu]